MASGDDVAATLLRALPADVAAAVLGKIPGGAADALKAKAQGGPPTGEELDAALAAFFDVSRIADRPDQPGRAAGLVPAGVSGEGDTPAGTSPAAREEGEPTDPLERLRRLPAPAIARALDGESAGTVAVVLSALTPALAGAVLKRLPAERRAEVGLRVTQPAPKNPAVLARLAEVIADRAAALRETPADPTPDERIDRLADMLRALPRADRLPILARIDESDPELSAKVRDKLYRIDDLLKVPDRPLQQLLAELDVKTIATALKGTTDELKAKVTSNMSSRSRDVLNEESELLGQVPPTRAKEKQNEVLAVLRKYEDEGKIVIDE